MTSKGDALGPAGQIGSEPVKGDISDAKSMIETMEECGVGHKVKRHRAVR